jgi:phosphate transport system protein
MPQTPDGFTIRIARLKADLVAQFRRVQALIEAACDAAFARDVAAADGAILLDEAIDRVDIAIERAAVQLLTDATATGAALRPDQLRGVLTIVKVNNELERVADSGVAIAELSRALLAEQGHLPDTVRVITNSVIGILRDVGTAFDRDDPAMARVVLTSEDAIEEFKKAIIRDAQVQLSTGKMSVDLAFLLQELGSLCELMAAHCTNIAEQVLYSTSGTVMRHMGGHWEVVPPAHIDA